MERNNPEEDATVGQSDEGALDGAVDHQRLARLVARSEPVEEFSPPAPSLVDPRSAQARHSKFPLVIALAIGVVGFVILAYAVGFFIFFRSATWNVSPAESGVNPASSPDNTAPSTGAKAELLAVPGGTFRMGREGGPVQEAPQHAVTVPSFAMDNTEVTNAEYVEFVRMTNHAPPSHWDGNSPSGFQEQMPVVNVSLEDAKAFAAWRSERDRVTYRLPTEEEWEYAARGGDQGNLYPWGNSWIDGLAATRADGLVSPKPVGSYPGGKARWGHLDMIGNVWEWTSSKASYYPGSTLAVKPDHQNWAIVRGGSLASDSRGEKAITNAYRDWLDPTVKNPVLGFRLVRDSKQEK